MTPELQIITAPGLAVLLIELVKWFVRKAFLKNPEFDFSEVFYFIMTPVMTFLANPLLALIGLSGFEFPTDLMGWAQQLVIVVLSSLFTTLVYNQGLKPLKEYAKNL